MDGECTRISDAASDTVSSEASFTSGLARQGCSGVLGNFSLNLVTIVSNTVMSFRNM